MTTLIAPSEAVIPLSIGERLVVTAITDATGRVRRIGAPGTSAVSGSAPAQFTAAAEGTEFRVMADYGTLEYRIEDVLSGAIKIATRNIESAVVIAKALNEGKRMALADKAKLLTDRAKGVPAAIEARLDKSLARLAVVETRATAPLDRLDAHITDTEASIKAAEDAVAQLSNGGPLAE